jgi:hypothetical protein
VMLLASSSTEIRDFVFRGIVSTRDTCADTYTHFNCSLVRR